GEFDDAFYGVDRAQRVRDMCDGHNLHTRPKHFRKFIHQEFAVIIDWNDAELRATLFRKHLPRDDIRMMFESGDEDLVTGVNEFATIAVSDKIDALSGPAGIDDLARFGGIDESLDFDLRVFVFARCELAQIMHATVHIGVLFGIVAQETVDHDPGLLGSCCVVEIDQPASVDFLVEDGEVFADEIYIKSHNWIGGDLR